MDERQTFVRVSVSFDLKVNVVHSDLYFMV